MSEVLVRLVPMWRGPQPQSAEATAVPRFVDEDTPDLFRPPLVVGQPAISVIEALPFLAVNGHAGMGPWVTPDPVGCTWVGQSA